MVTTWTIPKNTNKMGTEMAPEVGLEPTPLRLTAACSTIELLWITEKGGG